MNEVMEHKELLREGFANLIAKLDQSLMKGEKNAALLSMKDGALDAWNDILGDGCKTMEDVRILQGKYLFLQKCLERMSFYGG